MLSQEKLIKGGIILMVVTVLCTAIVVISGIWLSVIAARMNRRRGLSVNHQGILTVIFIAGVYCVSYLPLLGYYLLATIRIEEYGYLRLVCLSIPYINNIANVFLYMLSQKSFRNFLRKNFIALCFSKITDLRGSTSP
jgi:hypothetical protein